MSILTFNDLAQTFGQFDIFASANGRIEKDSRIGLVGPNGIGKTSLLRIIAGLERQSRGSLSPSAGLRFAYLRQEAIETFADAESTLYDAMIEVFGPVKALEAQMRDLEDRMAEDASEAVMTAYGDAMEEFEARGGYDYEFRTEQTLAGLGFTPEDYSTPVRLLSGGQKTRALLAKLLLERPDLLILDEPTNHLDIQALTWLEGVLSRWQGALLVVSHDRKFLDQVVNTVWAMSRGGIDTYKGNYSAYTRQRHERQERAMLVYEAEMERMWKEFDFIKRFKKDGDAQAVGRLRRLSRDLVAIEELGIVEYKQSKKWSETGVGGVRMFTVAEAESALKAIRPPVGKPPRLRMRIETGQRSGERVLTLRNLTVGYPNRPLFTVKEEALFRGQVVALTGGNGSGKTTLLKTLMEQIEPLNGRFDLGHNVRVGYFAQAHDNLDTSKSALDTLIDAAHALGNQMGIAEARHLLAAYLFRGDEVYKLVGDLSGGERGRLALAMLSLNGANLLLLDEPTNHLDVQAQEALQQILEDFPGTILMVSHDRYLIDQLATHIWEVSEGGITVIEREAVAA
ncbi:MAG: ABC-F family ATP-binding cassette domain-containing protein [Anaerolineae bacterium]|nr:ABC-F family ATP-binding cassette domain-containing protein [Anaerolineae bacterium]